MNEKELRELDAWIAVHVMRYIPVIRPADSTYPVLKYWIDGAGLEILQPQFSPTSDEGSAMQVLKRCREIVSVALPAGGSTGVMVQDLDKKSRYAIAETLELAICLFAKKLFTK